MNLGEILVGTGLDLSGLTSGLQAATDRLKSFIPVAEALARQAGQGFAAFAGQARVSGTRAATELAAGFGSVNGRLAASFAELDKQRERFEEGFGRAGEKFQSVGEAFSKYVTLPIIAGVALSAKSAIDFESAFAGVKKTLNTTGLDAQQTEAEYARLSAGIRQMATSIPAAADAIAKVAETAGQLGIKRENVLEFTRVMIDLGNSTNLSADQAATSLARLANITQLPQSQFSNLGSSIVALGNNFATTESEISDFGLRLAGAGSQIGLTQAEILGIGTALSSVGVNAEAGGTAISTVFKKIDNAVRAGGAGLAAYAKISGQTAEQFANDFKSKPAAAFTSFIEGLSRVKEAGGNVNAVLTGLGLANVRTADSLLRLAGAGDLTARAITTSTEAFAANTALSKEAGQRYETTASQIQIAKNKLVDLGITIGNVLLPLIKSLSSTLGGAADALNSMSPAAARTTLVIGGLVAAIGPLTLAFGGILAALPSIVEGLAIAAPAFEAFGAAVTLATGPVGIAITALAALAGGIYYLAGASERSVEAYQKQATATDSLVGSVNPLLTKYDELVLNTKRNTTEQAALEDAIKKLAIAVPSAVTAIDQYGNATAISSGKIHEYTKALLEQKAAQADLNLPAASAKLGELATKYQVLKKQQDEFNKTGSIKVAVFDSGGGSVEEYKAGSQPVKELRANLADANAEYQKQLQLVEALRAASKFDESVAGALSGQGNAALQAAGGLTKATGAAKSYAETIAEMRVRLKALQADLEGTVGGSAQNKSILAQIAALEALIKKYTDTGSTGRKAADEIAKAFAEVKAKINGADLRVKIGMETPFAALDEQIAAATEGLKKVTDLKINVNDSRLVALNATLVGLISKKQQLDKIDSLAPKVTVTPDLDGIALDRIEKKLREDLKPIVLKFQYDNDVPALKAAVAEAYKTANAAVVDAGVSPANPRAQTLNNKGAAASAQSFNTQSLRQYTQAMTEAAAAAEVFGNSFSKPQAELQITGQRLVDVKVQLKNLYDDLAAGKEIDFGLVSSLEKEQARLTPLIADLKKQVAGEKLVADIKAAGVSAIEETAELIGTQIGNVIAGTESAGDALKSVFNGVLGIFGDFLVQLGQALIAYGVAIIAAKAAKSNPYTAIVFGALAIAAGSALNAVISKGPTGSGSSATSAAGSGYSPSSSTSATGSTSTTGNSQLKIEIQLKPVDFRMAGPELRALGQLDSWRLRSSK